MKEILAVLLFFFIYFAPSLIANSRHHRSGPAICLLNIVLGWTILGWFLALLWSLTGNVREPEPPTIQNPPTTASKIPISKTPEQHKADLRLATFWCILAFALVAAIALTASGVFSSKDEPTKTQSLNQEPNFISVNGKVVPNPKKQNQSLLPPS